MGQVGLGFPGVTYREAVGDEKDTRSIGVWGRYGSGCSGAVERGNSVVRPRETDNAQRQKFIWVARLPWVLAHPCRHEMENIESIGIILMQRIDTVVIIMITINVFTVNGLLPYLPEHFQEFCTNLLNLI